MTKNTKHKAGTNTWRNGAPTGNRRKHQNVINMLCKIEMFYHQQNNKENNHRD